MDHINITGIQADTLIGVYDWERQQKRSIVIDLVLYHALNEPGDSDDLLDTIDYAAVVDWIRTQTDSTQYHLLESLAEHLAQGLLDNFSIKKISLTIHKPKIIDNVDDISVCIIRP